MKQAMIIDRIMLWVGRMALPVTAAMFGALAVVGFAAAAADGIKVIGPTRIVEIPPAQILAMAIVWTIAAVMLAYASSKAWRRKPLMN